MVLAAAGDAGRCSLLCDDETLVLVDLEYMSRSNTVSQTWKEDGGRALERKKDSGSKPFVGRDFPLSHGDRLYLPTRQVGPNLRSPLAITDVPLSSQTRPY